MQICTLPALRQLALAGAAILLLAAAPGRSDAAFVLTLGQAGSDVVVGDSGTINTTDSTLETSNPTQAQIEPNMAILIAGLSGTLNFYDGGGLAGPAAFGAGLTQIFASSETGSPAGVYGDDPELFTPPGYTSGTLLTESSSFTGQFFSPSASRRVRTSTHGARV